MFDIVVDPDAVTIQLELESIAVVSKYMILYDSPVS